MLNASARVACSILIIICFARHRGGHRSKSFDSLDKFHKYPSLSSMTRPDTLSGTPPQQNGNYPFNRNNSERHSSGSVVDKQRRLTYDIPTHLTYSLDHFLESQESSSSHVDAGIRVVPMSVNVELQVESGLSKFNRKEKTKSNLCCIITALVSIIFLLFFLMAVAGSAIVFCTVGQHCGRN